MPEFNLGWYNIGNGSGGSDVHLDIGLQEVKSSSLVSTLFREAFSHPYISLFHSLVNGFSVIVDIYLLCKIKVRVKWCTCSM